MGFIKCPRCELNYIREEEQYCSVCKREMKGEVAWDFFIPSRIPAAYTSCGTFPGSLPFPG